MPPEHHIPLRPILGVLQVGIRAKVLENQGIPLVNVSELLEMDPYEEVAQQGQAPPLSPAYVPDPMKLDEHDHPYADNASPTAESPRYIANSYLMEEDTDEDSIDYPDEPEDDDEDPEEDDDEDLEEDLSKEHKPEDDGEDPEEDPRGSMSLRMRILRRRSPLRTPMAASTQALIDAFAAGSPLFPLPPTSPAYDQASLGHRAAMIHMRDDIPEEDIPPQRRFLLTAPPPGCDVAKNSTAAARPPRGQYDFVDTVKTGQGLIRSPGHDAQTIAKTADRAEDVGYVRALQDSEHRMMTSIKEVNLRVSYQAQVRRRESEDFYIQLHDARTNRKDIRLEIDIVRGQRTAYETELHEVCQAYLSSEAQNRALLARLETLETYMSCMEWQRQSAEDRAVRCNHACDKTRRKRRHDSRIYSSYDRSGAALTWWNGHVRTLGHDVAYAMTWGTLKKKLKDKYCLKGEIKKLEIELWNLKVRGNDVAAYTQRFQELALMCTKFLTDETEKVDKYISGLPDNIHGNVMSA
ncbi:putative reverse transcriptase domain-containing protein [Tanacetum coccineum]